MASAVNPRARTSWSSQSDAVGYGSSSDDGWIEQYSVQTVPQPPSAYGADIDGFEEDVEPRIS
jgi:hypothetical protein